MISIAIPTLNIAIKQLDWQLANETLKALCGHTVRLHIKPPEMIFDVTFTPEHPVIHTKLDDQPDCTITLSPSDALKIVLTKKHTFPLMGIFILPLTLKIYSNNHHYR